MLALIRQGFSGLVLGLCAVAGSGCDAPAMSFKTSSRVEALAPQARTAIMSTVQNRFGSPGDLRCPPELPVDRGGFSATIEAFSEDRKQITVSFETPIEPADMTVGQRVEWIVDETSFDEEQRKLPLSAHLVGVVTKSDPLDRVELALDVPVPEYVEAGGLVVVDPCRKLELGQRLYRQHCLHCHGATGDGKGPTAAYMEPPPRDFRMGLFKYTSTFNSERAQRNDLREILRQGIAGTYMPSFKLLSPSDADALVSYVMFLANRGEIERRLVDELEFDYSQTAVAERLEGGETQEEIDQLLSDYIQNDLPLTLAGLFGTLKDDFERANDEGSVVVPKVPRPLPAQPSLANPALTSLDNGRLLYLSKKAQCVACHGEAGRGDGIQTRELQKAPDGTEYPRPGLHDAWGNLTPPRNLTQGVFRGGTRPIDVFRRIHAGIKGTRMLAFGGTGLTDAEIWDVVNYVLSLSHQTSAGAGLSDVSQQH